MKEPVQIKHPDDIISLLKTWARRRQEHFLVITLNAAHEVIRVHCVSMGIVNRTIANPREIFFPAIKDNALKVIFAHNHPSGHINPSLADDDLHERLEACCQILGFSMMDNLIITKSGKYYSYRREGRITKTYEDSIINERRRYAKDIRLH